MFSVLITKRGQQDLDDLDKITRRRLLTKLTAYAATPNPLTFAKPLINLPPTTHRFRVGKYRILFFIEGRTIFVERIEPRKDAY